MRKEHGGLVRRAGALHREATALSLVCRILSLITMRSKLPFVSHPTSYCPAYISVYLRSCYRLVSPAHTCPATRVGSWPAPALHGERVQSAVQDSAVQRHEAGAILGKLRKDFQKGRRWVRREREGVHRVGKCDTRRKGQRERADGQRRGWVGLGKREKKAGRMQPDCRPRRSAEKDKRR